MPMYDAFRKFCATKPARYCAEENISMLMSGWSTRFCLRTNSTRNTAPSTSGTQMNGLSKEKLLASENASSTPPKPSVEKRQRNHVEVRRSVRGRRRLDHHGRHHAKCHRDDHQQDEVAAPTPREAHGTPDGGANVRREPHRNARHAHGRGLAARRETRHGDGLQKRHEHAGGHGLAHAPRQHHAEVRRQQVEHRTRQEESQPDEHVLPHREPPR